MTPQVIANSMLFHSCKRIIDVTFKEEQRNKSLVFQVSLTDKMGGCIFLTFPTLVHNCSGVVSTAWKSFGLQRRGWQLPPSPVQDQRLKISLMYNQDEGLPHSWAHSGTDITDQTASTTGLTWDILTIASHLGCSILSPMHPDQRCPRTLGNRIYVPVSHLTPQTVDVSWCSFDLANRLLREGWQNTLVQQLCSWLPRLQQNCRTIGPAT